MTIPKFNFGLLVGVREFSGFIDGTSYSGPTGMKAVNDFMKLTSSINKAWENGEVDAKTALSAITFAGDLFNVPVKPIERVIKASANDGSPLSYLTGVGYQPH